MFIYHQASGKIERDGATIGTGYSGHGDGLNNHTMEAVAGVGPIPVGKWRIVEWDAVHSSLGPVVGILEPTGHTAHGRSLFRIHGDNREMNHTASDGCIIASRPIREAWRNSGEMEFEVV